jgi:hypothetical protein
LERIYKWRKVASYSMEKAMALVSDTARSCSVGIAGIAANKAPWMVTVNSDLEIES